MTDFADMDPKWIADRESEIIMAIWGQLLKLDIQVSKADIRSAVAGGILSVWVEQKGGLDSSDDKFEVDLKDLAEGTDYGSAAGYRARRWSRLLMDRWQAGFTGMASILMAEDDEDDRLLIGKFFEEAGVRNPLRTVANGEELLDYLHQRGDFSGPGKAPAPCLILLDLNMPRMDGRSALKVIKQEEGLREIPIVVLTTSQAAEDIEHSYGDGANSYVTKPKNMDEFTQLVRTLKDYWLNVVRLPVGGIEKTA